MDARAQVDAVPASLLTIAEAADVLHVHAKTLHRWIRAGRLPVVRLTGRSVRVRPEALLDFIDRSAGL